MIDGKEFETWYWESIGDQNKPVYEAAREAWQAARQQAVPSGYVMAPVEPTAEMLEAYCGTQPSNIAVYLSGGIEPYKAMLYAAPAVQGEAEVDNEY